MSILTYDIPWGQKKPPYGTRVNRKDPIGKNVVGCWLFNEGAGPNAYDASGYGNHGALQALSTGRTAWGQRRDVAFSSSGLILAAKCPYPVAPFALVIDVSYTTPSNAIIWEVGGNLGFSLQVSGFNNGNSGSVAGGLLLTCGYDGNGQLTVTKSVWNDGKTHRVIFLVPSYRNGTTTVFVDGHNDTGSTHSAAAPTYASAPMYFGSRNGTSGFGGQIGSAAVVSRALTPAEVQRLYANPFGMFQGRELELGAGGNSGLLLRRRRAAA